MKSPRCYKLTPRKTEFTSTLEILKSITDFIHKLLAKKNEPKGTKIQLFPLQSKVQDKG